MDLTIAKDIKDKRPSVATFKQQKIEKNYMKPLLNRAGDLVTDIQIAEVLLIGSIPMACRTSQDVSLIGFVHFLIFKTNQI